MKPGKTWPSLEKNTSPTVSVSPPECFFKGIASSIPRGFYLHLSLAFTEQCQEYKDLFGFVWGKSLF